MNVFYILILITSSYRWIDINCAIAEESDHSIKTFFSVIDSFIRFTEPYPIIKHLEPRNSSYCREVSVPVIE